MAHIESARPAVSERSIPTGPGVLMLLLGIIIMLGGIPFIVNGIALLDGNPSLIGFLSGMPGGLQLGLGLAMFIGGIMILIGITVVAPNEARVVQLFGRYRGTIHRDGLHWVNPLTSRAKISRRIRNHETSVMKVNDADGNPIEISAVVVWQVEDTARASFEVDNYVDFVTIQTETAVRFIANQYPYDGTGTSAKSLRDNSEEITRQLSEEVADRVSSAGVHVIESRITHLAYASEIAQAMLQRQQASAVVAARTQIVEGAIGMVDLALQRLNEQGVVELDEDRKATMVSNLLVVLCADRATQPVVNTGSIY